MRHIIDEKYNQRYDLKQWIYDLKQSVTHFSVDIKGICCSIFR